MANKKPNKVIKNKKPVKPAHKKPNKVIQPKAKATPQKKVRVQKVQVSSIPEAVVEESKKTYKFGKYEVKKSYVWAAAIVVVLLYILF